MKFKKLALVTLISSAAIFTPVVVNAQTATPIDELETEMAKLDDVYDDIVPVAIGAAAFSVGMVLIKRVAFS